MLLTELEENKRAFALLHQGLKQLPDLHRNLIESFYLKDRRVTKNPRITPHNLRGHALEKEPEMALAALRDWFRREGVEALGDGFAQDLAGY